MEKPMLKFIPEISFLACCEIFCIRMVGGTEISSRSFFTPFQQLSANMRLCVLFLVVWTGYGATPLFLCVGWQCHPNDNAIPQGAISENYVSNTDVGAPAPPLSPSMIVNPADMTLDASKNGTKESDTCEEFDDSDDWRYGLLRRSRSALPELTCVRLPSFLCFYVCLLVSI